MHELYIFALTQIDPGELPNISGGPATIQTITGVILGFIGAISLLVIVLSGFRYITSAGDPERASKAKNGIIYALVALVVAVSAQSIVAFVVNRL